MVLVVEGKGRFWVQGYGLQFWGLVRQRGQRQVFLLATFWVLGLGEQLILPCRVVGAESIHVFRVLEELSQSS